MPSAQASSPPPPPFELRKTAPIRFQNSGDGGIGDFSSALGGDSDSDVESDRGGVDGLDDFFGDEKD
ncbi:hypothetical protein HO133_009985 [Letharia lupina]|uniref:Uncharacterized protein n=1 Tax=Letharia lupina TaxID=560253 RepID=A0A8H6CKI9_9LECA|nr:uncharacterized protein HO133_009985 [Letharia lupina]KAF6224791.1 hypothetical protein HO133_009985 [Letharia lupina]